MKWFRIEKENGVQPQSGSYKNWKEILAEEGRHQCVYCAIHEASSGGIRNFHVEHYKPKSKAEFEHLENDIQNLFYACPVCNTFKGDDWPCDPPNDLSTECYANPSEWDYTYLFLDAIAAELVGKSIAARYMIVKLYLNRPQLIMERRQEQVLESYKTTKQMLRLNIEELMGYSDTNTLDLLKEYLNQRDKIEYLLIEMRRIIPYRNDDVSR